MVQMLVLRTTVMIPLTSDSVFEMEIGKLRSLDHPFWARVHDDSMK